MNERRTFLRQLAALPLIGGGVSIIGRPTAVAEPVTDHLMWRYKDWLFYEHRMVSFELAGHDLKVSRDVERYSPSPIMSWHDQWEIDGARGPAGWTDAPQPSTRAALVLSTVGCDWRCGEEFLP